MIPPTAQQKAEALARIEKLDGLTPLGRADLIAKIKSGEFFKASPGPDLAPEFVLSPQPFADGNSEVTA